MFQPETWERERDAERVGDEDNVRRTRRMWIRVQWLTWVPVAGMGRGRAASGSMLGCTTLCGISWFSWCSWQPCTLRAWRCHTLCKVAVIMGIIAASFGMCIGNMAIYFTGYLDRVYAGICTWKKCEKLKILHDMREYIYSMCVWVWMYVCIFTYRFFSVCVAFMHISHNTFRVEQQRLNHPKGGRGTGVGGGMAWTGTSLFAVSLPLKLDLNHQQRVAVAILAEVQPSPTPHNPRNPSAPSPSRPPPSPRVDLCSEFAFIYHYTWKHFRFVSFIIHI